MKTHTHAILTAALLLTTAVYGETLPERQQQSPQRNTSQSTTSQPSPARPSPQSAHTPQGEYGSVTGLVECRSDSTTYVLGQVNVKGVFGGRDTLYTYTLNNGIFTFERALPGKATITVSHIGYKSVTLPAEATMQITLDEIIDAINREDPLCIEILEEIGQKLGKQIASLINIFNPELVIIGGRLSLVDEYLTEPIKSAIRKYSLNLVNKDSLIAVSKLKDKAGVIGACMLARSRMFEC